MVRHQRGEVIQVHESHPNTFGHPRLRPAISWRVIERRGCRTKELVAGRPACDVYRQRLCQALEIHPCVSGGPGIPLGKALPGPSAPFLVRRSINSFRYVQAWVDGDGRVHRYFRRPGYPRVPLPGLPGWAEFNRAYEAALESPTLPVGAKRTKPGSLNAAITGYYTSLEYRSLAAGTQKMRRAILER